MEIIGKSVIRKDAWEKVTGQAKYTSDLQQANPLHVQKVISPYGHALIKKIKVSKAKKAPGVRAVITGGNLPLTGEEIRDRYPIAHDRVRYHGEVVAFVVADTLKHARFAANLIEITYEALPVIQSPTEALNSDATLLHEQLGQYIKIGEVNPVPGTNIANRSKIRKGDKEKGWKESEVIVEESFSFRPSDHAAMEARCALGRIGEHGLIGMPAALANSLSLAAGVPLNQLPLLLELIWKSVKGER
ncbi:hypothetical protein [Peribacillus sp. Hz7]|uniref:hypothetical protein n=1 Tax=Peribacillus sp. Hz7 TaxID=3344873 RepID=UPI0035C94995